MIYFLFPVISFLYALVGFGGGTSYLAILLLTDIPYEWIPKISLICNIVVVGSSSFFFFRSKISSFDEAKSFLVFSIPCSVIGGMLIMPKSIFCMVAAICLFCAGITMLIKRRSANRSSHTKQISLKTKLLVGAILGFVSGLIGIGGGIFLSPLLFLSTSLDSKKIAANSSFFILGNSLFGLLGQVLKPMGNDFQPEWLFLPILVFVGGFIGNYFCRNKLNSTHVQKATGLLVLWVSIRILMGKA